jgi:hypothetical protein
VKARSLLAVRYTISMHNLKCTIFYVECLVFQSVALFCTFWLMCERVVGGLAQGEGFLKCGDRSTISDMLTAEQVF